MAKIYVGTYAKYNKGSIAGAWIDCEDYSDKEDFYAACTELHSDESDPEFMFQDHEEIPTDFISESSVDARLWEFLDLDAHEREIVEAWLSENTLCGEALQSIVDAFCGTYEDWADYAEQITRDGSDIPGFLEFYIDWEKMGRDLSFEESGVEYGGKLYIFGR